MSTLPKVESNRLKILLSLGGIRYEGAQVVDVAGSIRLSIRLLDQSSQA